MPSSGAYALPRPGLQDGNRIRNGTDLIRLRSLEESCNPIAELGVRLGMWPVEGVRGGAGPGRALGSDVREAAQSRSCLGPSEGQESLGSSSKASVCPVPWGCPEDTTAVVAASSQSRRELLERLQVTGPEAGRAA